QVVQARWLRAYRLSQGLRAGSTARWCSLRNRDQNCPTVLSCEMRCSVPGCRFRVVTNPAHNQTFDIRRLNQLDHAASEICRPQNSEKREDAHLLGCLDG